MKFPAKFDPAQQRDVCLGLAAHHEELSVTAATEEDRLDHKRAAIGCRERAAAWEAWRLSPERKKALREWEVLNKRGGKK